MYDNIGEKIKGLAKTMFIVEAIGAVITGIALLATDDDFILAGLLTLFCGPIVAWVSSWILYAFGQFVEDIHAMRNKYFPITEEMELREAEENAKRMAKETELREAEEKAKQDAKEREALSALVFFCPECNQTFIGRNCDASDMPECPNCKTRTHSTGISKGEWVQMSKEDRKNKLQEISK